jgi:uncharacterized protein YndB with AHSA1/START domain
MAEASRTILINRPIEEVFAFFTTPSNDPSWRTQVKEISGQPREGARIHQVVKGPGGTDFPSDMEVTAFEPPTRYAFRVVGPVRPEGEFRLTPVGTQTEVTFHLSAEIKGLKALALARPAQSAMDSEVGGLDTAKRLLES